MQPETWNAAFGIWRRRIRNTDAVGRAARTITKTRKTSRALQVLHVDDNTPHYYRARDKITVAATIIEIINLVARRDGKKSLDLDVYDLKRSFSGGIYWKMA